MKKEGNFSGQISNFFPEKKQGQLTIFIIVAVGIITLGAIIFLIFPQLFVNFGLATNNPEIYMQNCMGDYIKNITNVLSMQGGDLNPQSYISYQNNKIEYLCYTNQNYIPCVMQQSFLKENVQSQINQNMANKVQSCFSSLKSGFESQGYIVQLSTGGTQVEILPQKLLVTLNATLVLTKGSNTQRFNQIRILLNNNLYELISIANSILNWEATYGDVETTTYMNYYHDLKVEKYIQDDGSKIYILTNRDSGDKFEFATRSLVFPPGI